MNDQNQNNTNTSNEKINVVDANLLNPFQNSENSVNNSSLSTSNEIMTSNIQSVNNSITSENNNNLKDNTVQFQNNVNNQSNSTMSSSNVSDINNNYSYNNVSQNTNTSIPFNNMTENNVNYQSQAPINIQQINNNIPNTTVSKGQSSIVFLILVIISVICFFGKGIISIIGISFCVISLIGSIIMLKKKAKLSMLSLITSIIVLAVYVFSFVLAFNTIDNYINQTKSSIFKSTAHSFIMQTYQDILFDEEMDCNKIESKGIKRPLSRLAKGGTISPFGGNYDYNLSYILVQPDKVNGMCKYKMSIYLTDGAYSLGTTSSPIVESDIDNTSIKKN